VSERKPRCFPAWCSDGRFAGLQPHANSRALLRCTGMAGKAFFLPDCGDSSAL
jgi:hypothetical protein